jgi:hypothetical protein
MPTQRPGLLSQGHSVPHAHPAANQEEMPQAEQINGAPASQVVSALVQVPGRSLLELGPDCSDEVVLLDVSPGLADGVPVTVPVPRASLTRVHPKRPAYTGPRHHAQPGGAISPFTAIIGGSLPVILL